MPASQYPKTFKSQMCIGDAFTDFILKLKLILNLYIIVTRLSSVLVLLFLKGACQFFKYLTHLILSLEKSGENKLTQLFDMALENNL